MKNKLLLCLLFFWFLSSLGAQSNGVVVRGKWADQVSITDMNGRPFMNKYDGVNGHPYFIDGYKYCKISLANGKTFINIRAKINLENQSVQFLSSNNVEGYIEVGNVKEISFEDTSEAGIQLYQFKTGYQAIDNQSQNYFYQVLADGKLGLLRSLYKYIYDRKNELSGELSRDFETTENFYFLLDGKLTKIKKDKDFMLTVFASKAEAMKTYMQANKINFKNTTDLVKLVNFYNAL